MIDEQHAQVSWPPPIWKGLTFSYPDILREIVNHFDVHLDYVHIMITVFSKTSKKA